MADLDITQDNASNAHLSLIDPLVWSAGQHTILQSIGTMNTYLLANGYTAAQINYMTKNDMLKACREKIGGGFDQT